MKTILVAILLLTDILEWIIIIDIILSWLTIFGINLKLRFLTDIIEPVYKKIKKIIPTTFGLFEFAPIILFIILIFIQQLVYAYDANLIGYYRDLLNF